MSTHALTIQILRNYYPVVVSLKDYIEDIAPNVSLLIADDPTSYATLLDTCVVAHATTDPNSLPVLSYEMPSCSQSEVTLV